MNKKIDFKKDFRTKNYRTGGAAYAHGTLHYMKGEVFRPVMGGKDGEFDFFYPYWISNYGQLYSVREGRSLTPLNNGNGYWFYELTKDDKGTMKKAYMHRLVANAFCDNPENKPQVNHIDGDRGNNRADNLEWVTASENRRHARELKLKREQEA